jgi:hypothetical protein
MQTEILLEQIGLIQQDENIHATVRRHFLLSLQLQITDRIIANQLLQTLVEVIVGLGGKPNVQCTFNFDSVMKDVCFRCYYCIIIL